MRNSVELTKYVSSFLLGDSSISIDKRDYEKGGNATFECCQISDHLDYLQWMRYILEDICTFSLGIKPGRSQPEMYTFPNGITSLVKTQHRLRSRRNSFFNSFRDNLYIDGKKTVLKEYLNLFDWEAIAIWYMDDGFITSPAQKNRYGSIYKKSYIGLCTQCFTLDENIMLKNFLYSEFNLNFNVQKQVYKSGIKYRLVSSAKDAKKFVDGVSKYILPSFYYKLNYVNIKVSHNDSSSFIEDEDIV